MSSEDKNSRTQQLPKKPNHSAGLLILQGLPRQQRKTGCRRWSTARLSSNGHFQWVHYSGQLTANSEGQIKLKHLVILSSKTRLLNGNKKIKTKDAADEIALKDLSDTTSVRLTVILPQSEDAFIGQLHFFYYLFLAHSYHLACNWWLNLKQEKTYLQLADWSRLQRGLMTSVSSCWDISKSSSVFETPLKTCIFSLSFLPKSLLREN